MNQLSLYSTENINEGFQIINENWSNQSKQYVCTMDIHKCFDSIQIVFHWLIILEIAPFIGYCSFKTHWTLLSCYSIFCIQSIIKAVSSPYSITFIKSRSIHYSSTSLSINRFSLYRIYCILHLFKSRTIYSPSKQSLSFYYNHSFIFLSTSSWYTTRLHSLYSSL